MGSRGAAGGDSTQAASSSAKSTAQRSARVSGREACDIRIRMPNRPSGLRIALAFGVVAATIEMAALLWMMYC